MAKRAKKSAVHAPGSRALTRIKKYFPDVESVEDSDKPITVEVTQQDVASSKRKAHAGCAMAVACKRTKHLDGVIIATSTAYLIKGTKATRYEVPQRLSREVVSFDRGASFEPGEYSLIKPTRELSDGGNGSKTGKGRTRPYQHHIMTKNVRAVLGSDNER